MFSVYCFYFQACSWMIQMETTLKQDSTVLKLEDLNHRCDLFVQVCVTFLLLIFLYTSYIAQITCIELLAVR